MKCFVNFLISACLIALLGTGVGCGNDAAKAAAPVSVSVPVPVPLTNMVRITAGTFQRIRFPVTLTRDFWIGKYEVTQGEFQTVMGLNPSHFTGLSNHPVEKVSFVAASNYCVKVTAQERGQGHLPEGFEYRLPRRPSGNTPVALAPPTGFTLGRLWTAETPMPGLRRIARPPRIRSVARSPMTGACTTCTAMCGNGARIGLSPIRPSP